MSVLFPLAGNPQPPDLTYLTTTNRTSLFAITAGDKASTILSIGITNTDSNASVVLLEHYDGTNYRAIWKGSIAANSAASITGSPVGMTVNPGCSIHATADAGNRATVTINRVQQR